MWRFAIPRTYHDSLTVSDQRSEAEMWEELFKSFFSSVEEHLNKGRYHCTINNYVYQYTTEYCKIDGYFIAVFLQIPGWK